MKAVTIDPSPFVAWLEAELEARGSSWPKLAAALERKTQTFSAWRNEGRQPSTEFCRLVAGYLHLPQVTVLRAAGHITEPAEPEEEPAILPEIMLILREMTLPEQRRWALRAVRLADELRRETLEQGAS